MQEDLQAPDNAPRRARGDTPRVLHVITRLVRGGAQRIVLALVEGLARQGMDLTLAAGTQTGPEGSFWDEALSLGVSCVRLPSMVREMSPLKDFAALREMRRLIRSRAPDVMHAHTSKAAFIACLAARLEGVRAVVCAPHGHILGDGARIPGVPARGPARWLLAQAARRNAAFADVMVAPNASEREHGIRRGVWSARHSVVIPNGVDLRVFAPGNRVRARRALGLDPAPFVVGAAARLTREKGIDLVAPIAARLAGALFVIAGDGPERAAIERLARDSGVIDRVRFLGMQSRVETLLPAFDACLVPSRTEAHGMAAAEALACNIPVVAADVGGLRSLVFDGETGLCAAPEDVNGFAAALARLRDDPAFARRLAAQGRAHITANYSHEAMVSRTVRLYATLLARNRRRPYDRTRSTRRHGRLPRRVRAPARI